MKERTRPQPPKASAPSFPFAPTGMLQRECACGNHTMSGSECVECSKKQGSSLQRSAVSNQHASEVPSIVHNVLRSPGQPLDPSTRAFFEPRFDHDFRQVRVYTDAKAGESARAANALVLKMLWGRKLVCRWAQTAGNSLSQLSRYCVRNSA